MDLVTLNSTFHEDRLIEKYASLIWTERYSQAGDFQLVSNRIADTIKALPLDSYVSLRNSTVPMKVEAHKIEKQKGAAPKITVVGRSFEATTLELRVAMRAVPNHIVWEIDSESRPSDAAYRAIRQVIGDTNRYIDGVEVLPVTTAANAYDTIDEVDLILPADYKFDSWSGSTTYGIGAYVRRLEAAFPHDPHIYQAVTVNTNKDPNLFTPGDWTLVTNPAAAVVTTHKYAIPQGNLYASALQMVGSNHHAIKAARPVEGSNKVEIEIYNGADLTETVVFDAKFDQFDGATYLLSNTGSMNVAYMYGTAEADGTVVYKNTGPIPTGLNRRVMMMQLSEPGTTIENLGLRGLTELYKNNATALFGGEVAQHVGEGFNRDYFLGDIIKLKGEYGDLYQNVRVAEFIRTSDSSGEKAYPTFESIEAAT